MPVIKSVRAAKEAEILDSGHRAGFSKIRCTACKVGMAERRTGSDGKPEYYCGRCHRTFKISSI